MRGRGRLEVNIRMSQIISRKEGHTNNEGTQGIMTDGLGWQDARWRHCFEEHLSAYIGSWQMVRGTWQCRSQMQRYSIGERIQSRRKEKETGNQISILDYTGQTRSTYSACHKNRSANDDVARRWPKLNVRAS